MKHFAKGSVVLNALALMIAMLYVQPQVGAAAFFLADVNSQNNANSSLAGELNATLQGVVEEVQDPLLSVVNHSTETESVESEKKSASRVFKATAYCLKGRTASGGSVRRGIVAADPRQLPLGTRIKIEAGAYSGTYTVTDTGGAVKGRILDIWVPNCSEAIRFGRKSIKVSVLGKNAK